MLNYQRVLGKKHGPCSECSSTVTALKTNSLGALKIKRDPPKMGSTFGGLITLEPNPLWDRVNDFGLARLWIKTSYSAFHTDVESH